MQIVRTSAISAKVLMYEAAKNPPLFLDAFYSATQKVKCAHPNAQTPSASTINKVLEKFEMGYVLEPPRLLLREEIDLVPVASTSVLEEAHQEFRMAVSRSEELLDDGKPREAIQEILWLLESLATAFSGVTVAGTTIKGKYFNEIVDGLRHAKPDTTLRVVLDWLVRMHGYLSSPTGGGVRHGRALDLNTVSTHEAQLFCNLTRSYITYLLAEYERLRV